MPKLSRGERQAHLYSNELKVAKNCWLISSFCTYHILVCFIDAFHMRKMRIFPDLTSTFIDDTSITKVIYAAFFPPSTAVCLSLILVKLIKNYRRGMHFSKSLEATLKWRVTIKRKTINNALLLSEKSFFFKN